MARSRYSSYRTYGVMPWGSCSIENARSRIRRYNEFDTWNFPAIQLQAISAVSKRRNRYKLIFSVVKYSNCYLASCVVNGLFIRSSGIILGYIVCSFLAILSGRYFKIFLILKYSEQNRECETFGAKCFTSMRVYTGISVFLPL